MESSLPLISLQDIGKLEGVGGLTFQQEQFEILMLHLSRLLGKNLANMFNTAVLKRGPLWFPQM